MEREENGYWAIVNEDPGGETMKVRVKNTRTTILLEISAQGFGIDPNDVQVAGDVGDQSEQVQYAARLGMGLRRQQCLVLIEKLTELVGQLDKYAPE